MKISKILSKIAKEAIKADKVGEPFTESVEDIKRMMWFYSILLAIVTVVVFLVLRRVISWLVH